MSEPPSEHDVELQVKFGWNRQVISTEVKLDKLMSKFEALVSVQLEHTCQLRELRTLLRTAEPLNVVHANSIINQMSRVWQNLTMRAGDVFKLRRSYRCSARVWHVKRSATKLTASSWSSNNSARWRSTTSFAALEEAVEYKGEQWKLKWVRVWWDFGFD